MTARALFGDFARPPTEKKNLFRRGSRNCPDRERAGLAVTATPGTSCRASGITKCRLVKSTDGADTDIRLKDPACSRYEKKSEK